MGVKLRNDLKTVFTHPRKSHSDAGDQDGKRLQKLQSKEYGNTEAINWVQSYNLYTTGVQYDFKVLWEK